MAAAKAELVRRGLERARSGASWTPASLPRMRQVVDFESNEPDSRGGMGREVHFYWCVSPQVHSAHGSKPGPRPKSAYAHPCLARRKCVDEGKIEHVQRTFEEMHAEGSRLAGACLASTVAGPPTPSHALPHPTLPSPPHAYTRPPRAPPLRWPGRAGAVLWLCELSPSLLCARLALSHIRWKQQGRE